MVYQVAGKLGMSFLTETGQGNPIRGNGLQYTYQSQRDAPLPLLEISQENQDTQL